MKYYYNSLALYFAYITTLYAKCVLNMLIIKVKKHRRLNNMEIDFNSLSDIYITYTSIEADCPYSRVANSGSELREREL